MSNESRAVASLSSHALDRRLRELRGDERNVQVEFLLHLLEFDERRGWVALGHASLWKYCRCELGLLECAIWRRTRSMLILGRFPFVADYLRDGRIAMTTLVLVEKVLTPANAREVFDRISHRNVREVEEIVAELRPRPDVPTSLRKLPQPATRIYVQDPQISATNFNSTSAVHTTSTEAPPPAAGEATVGEDRGASHPGDTDKDSNIQPRTEIRLEERSEMCPVRFPVEKPARTLRVEIEPLSRERYLLKMTVDRDFVEALDKARSILSHIVTDGDRAAILRRALDEIIERDARRHSMKVERRAKKCARAAVTPDVIAPVVAPVGGAAAERVAVAVVAAAVQAADLVTPEVAAPMAKVPKGAKRGAIPRSIAAIVRARDRHCCAWKMPGGGVCGSTWRLQIDHIHPFALGGPATVENLRLVCAAHNLQHARDVFGDGVVNRYRQPSAARTSQEVPRRRPETPRASDRSRTP